MNGASDISNRSRHIIYRTTINTNIQRGETMTEQHLLGAIILGVAVLWIVLTINNKPTSTGERSSQRQQETHIHPAAQSQPALPAGVALPAGAFSFEQFQRPRRDEYYPQETMPVRRMPERPERRIDMERLNMALDLLDRLEDRRPERWQTSNRY
jgi:hypothetical protein